MYFASAQLDLHTTGAVVSDDAMKNIFVGNLNFKTSEEELRQLFAPYGRVDGVNILTDHETGCSRGFGFVQMAEAAEAENAIAALDGVTIDGHALRVHKVLPKHRAVPGS